MDVEISTRSLCIPHATKSTGKKKGITVLARVIVPAFQEEIELPLG